MEYLGRRGVSYGWRGRGMYDSEGWLTCDRDDKLDCGYLFESSSRFTAPCWPDGLHDPILEFLSNHETASPPPANELSGKLGTGKRGRRRTEQDRYPRKSHGNHGFRAPLRACIDKVSAQPFSVPGGTTGRQPDGSNKRENEKHGKHDQVEHPTRCCVAAYVYEYRAGEDI